ncbi:MAG: glycosyltransferase family 2 protein [Deltaproteobacteria bacterium]|nr:glycosyltransferase family 2 protein [Deltaproteobacteria bacterium]
MDYPSVSVVIPTLNSEKTLRFCLESVAMQEYPQELLEVIVVDAGSTDGTLRIIEEFRVESQVRTILLSNPLKTGEAGKAVGAREARNELIALIDSDNILPEAWWFQKMVRPFEDLEIFGSEPIEYTYRKTDNYVTRYCALMGMNDPLCYFLGNYDRKNYITMRWTDLPVVGTIVGEHGEVKGVGEVNFLKNGDRFEYIRLELASNAVPTIGANGTILRKDLLLNNLKSEYLFDIDLIYELVSKGNCFFAKVNVGIVHLFGNSLRTFYRKQSRRIGDYVYFRNMSVRSYPWRAHSRQRLALFVLYCAIVFPLLAEAIRGFANKRDPVWFLHPVFCWITLWAYGWGYLKGRVLKKGIDRSKWGE